MPGYNHHPNCTCGWCLKFGGARRLVPREPARQSVYINHQSTIPNAYCPVCGATVFFYQNNLGSRVFFDELGPPWPKHPCTDNSTYSGRQSQTPKLIFDQGSAPAKAGPFVQGWIALKFLRQKQEDEWTVLSFQIIETGEYVRILTHYPAELPQKLPVFMRPWDAQGMTELEYLVPELETHRLWGWRYADWYAASAMACAERRAAEN